ncbi:hypothetical protein RA2_04150 [Roseovarius sp. A-2]|nr:hypothetical protein RA2_04150 [Roseovarius sp. A-2]
MPIYSEGRVLPAQSRGDRGIANASTAHCTAFTVLGENSGTRFQAESHLELCHLQIEAIDKRTKLCLGLHTCPKEITPETLLAWKGDRQ